MPTSPGELTVSFPAFAETLPPAAEKEQADTPSVVANHLTAASVPGSGSDAAMITLTAISVNKNIITLVLDGVISDFKTFRLNKPERYVVDLMNVKSGLSTRLLPLNVSGVASARIGLYPDKVRVVFDPVNGSFPEATAVKTGSEVVITLDAAKTASLQADEPVEEKSTSAAKNSRSGCRHSQRQVVKPEAGVKSEPAKQAAADQPAPVESKTVIRCLNHRDD